MRDLEKHLVSVIISFLNVEAYITETLESVLNQDYKNWEVWLIDDGSTDNSTQISKEYANRFPDKIFYIDHEGHVNKGASESRNKGIERANGEFIAFLDGDDLWHPQYLSAQMALFKAHPSASLICEATEYWYQQDSGISEIMVEPVGAAQNCLYYPPQLSLKLYPLGRGAAPSICGLIVRSAVLKRRGMFEASFKGLFDDQVLLAKIYLNEPVYISSACNNRYRQRPGSLVHSTQRFSDYMAVRIRFLKWLQSYLQEQHLNYPEVHALIHKHLNYKTILWVWAKKMMHGVLKKL